MSDPPAAPAAATPSSTEKPQSTESSTTDELPRQSLHAQVAGILDSVRRVADLQLGIWIMGVKMAVLRVVLLAMLGLVSLLLAIVGIIFLYAGIYHVLTDLLAIRTAWALLIFAGAHLVLAGLLAVAAIALFNRRAQRKAKSGAAR